jgi:3-hydroxyisobutyrate dehydrogenase-like beta-hydroxyacid dehydrogenase
LKGNDGIFKCAKKGTYIVDCSTIAPMASKEFAEEAKSKDMVFVDSPMSGGIGGA